MKKKVGTRILSLLMVLVMALSLLPAAALASEGQPQGQEEPTAWQTEDAGSTSAPSQEDEQTLNSGAAEEENNGAEPAAEEEDSDSAPEAQGETAEGKDSDPALSVQAEDGSALTVGAPAGESDGAAVNGNGTSAAVSLAVQAGGAFLCAPQQGVSVSGNLAETYGYTDAVADGVSVLDVLVYAHELVYGDAFTPESCGDYLTVSSAGWASNVLGLGGNFGFSVNGATPNDGVWNEAYQSYTAYTLAQAPVTDGDFVEFYFYQDSYYLDNYGWFTSGGSKTLTAVAGGALPVELQGYCVCYYGAYPQETIDAQTQNIADAQLAWVDMETGALTDIDGAVTDENGSVTLTTPAQAGTYYLTAYIPEAEISENYATPLILPLQPVTVTAPPTALSLSLEETSRYVDGKLYASQGDSFQLTAVDEYGNETPVTWSLGSSYTPAEIDSESGKFTITQQVTSGSTSTMYFKATSTLAPNLTEEIRISLSGYQFSSYNRNIAVALSEDGQTAKTVSLTGGVSGHNVWSYDEAAAQNVAALSGDPGTGSSIKFNALRPGSFTVTVALDFDPALTDTATVNVTGVAVGDAQGNQTKTYLTLDEGSASPTAQLTAYCEAGQSVAGWSSSDEQVATVDENGLVTARGVGSTIITATDTQGKRGGIKVVVRTLETPYFESLEFLTSALESGAWVKDQTFSPTQLEYTLPIRSYSNATLTLQSATLYDTERYEALAEYTDANGELRQVAVNSGAATYLEDIPFDASTLTITLTDRENADSQTVYTFHVTRPRDTSKAIKSSTGIVLAPDGRSLLSTKYNGYAEGTMLRADESGDPTSGTGTAAAQRFYRTYLLEGTRDFSLNLASSTAYAHLRYSDDSGATWSELPQGGGATQTFTLPASGVAQIQIQLIDDAAYAANLAQGRDGFDGEVTTYTLWVEGVSASAADAQMRTASSDTGDWYPSFAPDQYSYNIVVPNGTASGTLTYTVAEGAEVRVGSAEQTPDGEGVYTLNLKTSAQTITVTSADGSISNSYSVKLLAKSSDPGPDAVVDYLCINSQYTNAGYGLQPEVTLAGGAGNVKSLGNFGGYITYYFADALTDNPNNPYGVDFYVYGNSQADGGSLRESGQVWVSEDGENWYALAGSEHYEASTIWDYSVTYTRTSSGRTAWTDNRGNSNDGAAQSGAWPRVENYPLTDLLAEDSVTLTGILLPCIDGTITGDGTTDSFAGETSFGYVDYYKNGTIGASVNPYVAAPTQSNGFDLAWAVDGSGTPVDVEGMQFHYVKVVTASNIWAGSFAEKSTEVSQVVVAAPAEAAVGQTSAAGVTISDANGAEADRTVSFAEGQQVYSVDLGEMRYITLSVDGAPEDANIYVNNRRLEAGQAAEGIRVTAEDGEKLVRVIVQRGEQEPAVYLLKLTSSAQASDEIIERLKLTVSGQPAEARTTDGVHYTLSVGHDVDRISIHPVCAPGVSYTVNGNAPQDSYTLEVGENGFTITATQGSTAAQAGLDEADAALESQTITLTVTRAAQPPASGETIAVTFSLLGDDLHGEDGETHTLSQGNLTEWIAPTEYTVPADATVLDVFELALTQAGYTWNNAGGSYIDMINGLAAFDNGPNSGWQFTYNGTYGSYSIAEQPLKDGDVVVFHYTDDYSLEDYGGGTDHPEEPGTPETPEPGADPAAEQIYRDTGAWIYASLSQPTYGGEWMVFGLARSGYPVREGYYADYYQSMVQAVQESGGVLSTNRYSEYARVILTLTAAGYDVTDVAGYNLLFPLANFNRVARQGINGPIFALLALDSAGYDIPAAEAGTTQTTREELIAYILERERSGGGWSLTGDTADPDVTAMAIQALAPYYDTDSAVQAAVDRALEALSAMQDDRGGFSSYSEANSESCAQVVVALTALGVNPDTDSRFVKAGGSVLDALCAYSVPGGGFSHVSGGERNGMATEQGYYALCAYFRFLAGQTGLYDMSDVTLTSGGAGQTDPGTPEKPETPGDDGAASGGEGQTGDAQTGSGLNGSPQTGDAGHALLVMAVLVCSAGALALLILRRRRARR